MMIPPAIRHAVVVTVILNLAVFAYYASYLANYGYLPAPFIFDKSNTFMDFFNPLYWAFNSGRYTEWGSVYPPLNFWILRISTIFFNFSEYDSPEQLRSTFELFNYGFGFLYLVSIGLLLKPLYAKKITTKNKIIFFLLVALSPPMLYALERGNLILFCPALIGVVIAYEGVIAALALAVAINLKPYLALLIGAYLLKANYRHALMIILISGAIFFVSGILLDAQFMEFFNNLVGFSGSDELFSRLELVAFPPNISPFVLLLQRGELTDLIREDYSFLLLSALQFSKYILLSLALLYCVRFRATISAGESLFFLTVVLLNSGTFIGGYGVILYFPFLVVMLNLRLWKFFFASIIGLCLPWDIVTLMRSDIGPQDSFLGQMSVDVNWTLGLGTFIRPIIATAFLALIPLELRSRAL